MLGASFFSVNAPLSLRRPLPRCNHPPIFDASKRIVSSTFARLDRNWSPQITLDARSMRRKERLRDRKGARNEASKSTERGAACRVFFFFWPRVRQAISRFRISVSFFSLPLSTLLFTYRDVARRAGRNFIERRVAVQKHRSVGCLDGSGRERGDANDGEQRG